MYISQKYQTAEKTSLIIVILTLRKLIYKAADNATSHFNHHTPNVIKETLGPPPLHRQKSDCSFPRDGHLHGSVDNNYYCV